MPRRPLSLLLGATSGNNLNCGSLHQQQRPLLLKPTKSCNGKVQGNATDEDDSSTSSTITVNREDDNKGCCGDSSSNNNNTSLQELQNEARLLQQQECATKKKNDGASSYHTTSSGTKTKITVVTKKSVRFNEALNVAYDLKDYYGRCGSAEEERQEEEGDHQRVEDDEDHAADTWYSRREYRQFKNNTVFMAKEICRAEAKNRAPFSYQRVMNRTYDACLMEAEKDVALLTGDEDEQQRKQQQRRMNAEDPALPESEMKHLRRWYEVATSRVGLERWSIRCIGQDKAFRRADIVDAVLDIQDNSLITMSSTRLGQHGQPSRAAAAADAQARLIRKTCERISLPSRLFARTLAQAQADAAKRQQKDEKKQTQDEEPRVQPMVQVQ